MSSTVNPTEIARFNQLASTWWQEDGPMWPLHKLNHLRAPYVTEQVCAHLGADPLALQPLKGFSVLDIGCGPGLLAEAMARGGAQVTAIDPAERNIAIAKHHANSQGLTIDYRIGSLEALAATEQFDVLLNMEVIEHVEDLPGFIAGCCSHTRPGGVHFIATINRTITSWFVAIIGAEYVLRWLPKGTHQWSKFVKPSEAQAMLGQHQHKIVTSTGVSINPLTKRYRLAGYLGVNYMVTAKHDA